MYSFSGFGAAYVAQVQAAAPECTTRAKKAAAQVTCTILRRDCKTANLPLCPTCQTEAEQRVNAMNCRIMANIGRYCDRAKIPVCRAAPANAVVSQNTLVTTLPTATPAPPPQKRALPTRDHKIPVPEPVPEPPMVEPAPGVPLWAWVVGGAAVVGGVAYFATRKKAA